MPKLVNVQKSVGTNALLMDPSVGSSTLGAWNTIVPPRGKNYRTARNVVSGTEEDIAAGVGATSIPFTGSGVGTPQEKTTTE